MTRTIRSMKGQVVIKYDGGRLADVWFSEDFPQGAPFECVQVRDYNFGTGEFGPEPSAVEIRAAVREFIEEAGGLPLYRANY